MTKSQRHCDVFICLISYYKTKRNSIYNEEKQKVCVWHFYLISNQNDLLDDYHYTIITIIII